jgi:hypothetical protein
MKNRTLLAWALLAALPASAQISFGGKPLGLDKTDKLPTPPLAVMPAVDVDALLAEDAQREAEGIKGPWRFGANHAVDLSLANSGVWHEMPNGDGLWRLSIECPGALSINFEFHDYVVPAGARVFVYNDLGEHLGAFTAESNGGQHSMGVTQLAGDRITIEYHEPAAVRGEGRLLVGQVTHAYRDVLGLAKGLGDSGACNNNVICPVGDNWRDQIRSVAMITVGGSGLCTGQLINNCAQDGTPYFLTARHCLPGNGNVSNWVYRFNWESPSCNQNLNGPTNFTMSGSQLLAQNAGSDGALIRLNNDPPASYNLYWTGWDRGTAAPTSSVAIHHPSGDVKKISFDNDPATSGTFGGAQCWRVGNWENGTTEGGSSGSGLWNQAGLLVGQLYGGTASCTSITNDFYGKFDLTYPVIQQWMGSCGNTLQGYDPNGTSAPEYDAALTNLTGIASSFCNSNTYTPVVTIRNNGTVTLTSLTLTWSATGVTGGTVTWSGSLATSQTANFTLPTVNAPNGAGTYTVTASNPNGQPDANPANNQRTAQYQVNNPGSTVVLAITLDNYGSETTWQVTNEVGTVLFTGGPYQNGQNGTVVNSSWCLGNGCYTFTMFDSYGDGICCAYGQGSYTITGPNVNISANGQFTEQDMRTFCVSSGVGIEEPATAGRLVVTPNPTDGLFTVVLPSDVAEGALLRLTDATGRTVAEQRIAAGTARADMDLSANSAGVYLLELLSQGQRRVERVVRGR